MIERRSNIVLNLREAQSGEPGGTFVTALVLMILPGVRPQAAGKLCARSLAFFKPLGTASNTSFAFEVSLPHGWEKSASPGLLYREKGYLRPENPITSQKSKRRSCWKSRKDDCFIVRSWAQ